MSKMQKALEALNNLIRYEGWEFPDAAHRIARRQKVRDYHEAKREAKRTRPQPAEGLVVELCGHQYQLLSKRVFGRSWDVIRISDGNRYVMTARQLNVSKVVA